MDVKLPNGKILRGIPEGTSKREIQAKAVNAGLAMVEDFPVHPAIDVEANRSEAVGSFVEGLPWYERLGIGVREPIAQAGARVEQAFGMRPRPEVQQGLEYSRSANDLATNVGRMLPAVAATARIPGGLVPSMAGGAAYGGLTGEDAGEGAIGGALGAGAGSIVGGMLGRSANAVAGRWAERAVKGADDTAQTIRDFQSLGGKLIPSQASGGGVTQQIDEALANNPVTSSAYNAIAKHNSALVTRLAAKALGVSSDDLGPTALRNADDVLTKQFNLVADRLESVPVSQSVATDALDLLSKRTGEKFAPKLQSGAMSGRTYMDLRSELLSITRSGGDKADDAWDLIDDLDQTVEGVAPPGYKEIYAAARERYKTLLSVDKYRRGISGGQVNAPTLEGAVQRIFKKQYTRDMPTQMPETKALFTALRAMADPRMASLTGGSPSAKRMLPYMVPLVAGGVTGDPLTGAAALGGMYMAPRAALAAPADPLLKKAGRTLGMYVGSEVE